MKISMLHWDCFRLANQEKRPIYEVAEILGVEPQKVKDLLSELRKAEPTLFPFEREYLRFGHDNMYREGRKLLQIDDICEEDIRQKF